MDRMVNNIQLTWKLAILLRAYRTCNPTVEFSKYEFYNNLYKFNSLWTIISQRINRILKITLWNHF